MKIIFLAPYPYDEVASQRFRFEQYYPYFRNKGHSFYFGSFYKRWSYRHLYKEKSYIIKISGVLAGFLYRMVHLIKCLDGKYVFIHRELTPVGPPVFEWIITKVLRKKVIYDFDDAIWIPRPDSVPGWLKRLRSYNKVGQICRWSHKISCGNEYLARYAMKFNDKVFVNPTVINTGHVSPSLKKSNNKITTIGWTGTHSTLPYLNDIIEGIQKILDEVTNTRLIIICNKKPDWKIENMEFIPWKRETELEDLSKIDIGLMPLTDDDWSRGKCGFKILQYFSLAIPALVSPVGENINLVKHNENGFLCNNSDQWYKAMNTLIADKLLREKFGYAGRKLVEDHYSVEANLITFFRLFE